MKFLKFKKINYTRSLLVTAKFSNSHNTSVVDYTEATVEWDQWRCGDDCDSDTGVDSTSVVDYTEATVEWDQWRCGDDCDTDTGVDRKLQVICRLCNKLLMIMLNC